MRLLRERHRREIAIDPAIWCRSFAGRPVEFIGEIVGQSWWSDDWKAWRVFIKALFGVAITDSEEVTIFRECTGLIEQPTGIQREAWMPIGRRGGKSRILAFIAIYLAVCFDWRPYLSPGERGYISILAAFRDQAQTIIGYVTAAFLDHPTLSRLLIGQPAAESVSISGSVVIRVATASFRAVRSSTTIAALCDEIAFWRTEDTSANPDREILEALKPSMLTIPNSMLFGASSPYARRGVLWEAYDQHYGAAKYQRGAPLVWKAPTWVMHPSIDRKEIDEKYEADPLSAAAEYGAEFRSDIAAFVDMDVVKALVSRSVHEIPPLPGVRYAAFCDPSGGMVDSMTLAIAHRDRNNRGVLDCVRERRPPFSPDDVVIEFTALLKSYGLNSVKGDRYGGDWPASRFREHGIVYEHSELTKVDVYREAIPILNAARVELLDNRRLVDQICSLERRTARGGRDSIDHPPGQHDDLANAALGAIVEVVGVMDPVTAMIRAMGH